MKHLWKLSACTAAVCVAAAVPSSAYAQEVTSTIRGKVTASGAPVPGAVVVVRHDPSGTTVTTTTNAEGAFNATGLRVGGPYSMKITASGNPETTITDINLVAGQPLSLPIELGAAEIVVTGTKTKAMVDASGGPASVLSRDQIEMVAAVRRDVRNLFARDPFADYDPYRGGVSIAGQDPRLNKFSIDGVSYSDNMGLNYGGLPTARGPVSIDAIEQLSVKVAPYDIREGDFQGGAVNVVLKSGTNTFHGDAFFTYSSDGLMGNKSQGTPYNLSLDSKDWGAFLSGPIIKDKLFFAVSYEELKEGKPNGYGPLGVVQVPGVSSALLDQITSITKSVYNYDTLGTIATAQEWDRKVSAKLDWNITNGQRFSFTYMRDDSNSLGTQYGSSSSSSGAGAFSTYSDQYSSPEKTQSFVAQLNSDWSSNFHTELRANYRTYNKDQSAYGAQPFSQFAVCVDPTETGSTTSCVGGVGATVYVGPDQYRHFNYVHTKQYGVEGAATINAGIATIKLDAGWQHIKIGNAFTIGAWGSYYFDSLADYQAGTASSFSYTNSLTGNINDVLASFQYNQYTFGGQVALDPSPNLNFTVGSRIDLYGGENEPPINQGFLNRYGFSNTSVVNGRYIFQPRASFTWKPTSTLQVRGGIGLFGGGSPNVFLGNSYSQANVYGNTLSISRDAQGGTCNKGSISVAQCNTILNGVTGRIANPSQLPGYAATLFNSPTTLATAYTNALSPDYHLESTWKTSLSVDWKPEFWGGGWNIGGDFYYGWVNYAPNYVDLRLTAIGTTPDGRTRYAPLGGDTSGNYDLLLVNARQGHSLVAVARIDKRFAFGLGLGASYTFQDIKDVNPMNNTTASGGYGGAVSLDPNGAAYGTSVFQVRNTVKGHISFDHAFFGDYKTRIDIFAQYRTGLPYSLTMTDTSTASAHGNVFGVDGTESRFLLYVPNVSSITADPKVTYASAADFTAIQQFVQSNHLRQGSIIDKNNQTAPGWTKLDLHLEQEIPLPFLPTGKIKIFGDMENFLNLLNSNWGAYKYVNNSIASVVNVTCAASDIVGGNCTRYTYAASSKNATGQIAPTLTNNVSNISLWSARVGVKIQF